MVFLTTLPLSHDTSITAFRVLHLVKDDPLLEGSAQRNQSCAFMTYHCADYTMGHMKTVLYLGGQFLLLFLSLSRAEVKEQASGPQHLVLGPASLSENVLEMQTLGPTPDLLNEKLQAIPKHVQL